MKKGAQQPFFQPSQRPVEKRLEGAKMEMKFGHHMEMRTKKRNTLCQHLGVRPGNQLPGHPLTVGWSRIKYVLLC